MTARTRVVTVTEDGRATTVSSTDPARVTNVGAIGPAGAAGTNGAPGADGDTFVPDPTAEPDDRWLKTLDGALVYTDAPAGGGGASAAEDVTFTPTGAVAATDVQAAIAELDTEKSATGHTHSYEPSGTVATHVADTADAHALAGITGLQAALDDKAATTVTEALDGRIDTLEAIDNATQVELDAHLNDTTAAHAASAVSFAPAGAVAATDVQAAIAELDTEKSATGHTHTASSVTDFSEAVDDRVAALLVAGSNVTLTYNDASGTLTIAASGGGGSSLSPLLLMGA